MFHRALPDSRALLSHESHMIRLDQGCEDDVVTSLVPFGKTQRDRGRDFVLESVLSRCRGHKAWDVVSDIEGNEASKVGSKSWTYGFFQVPSWEGGQSLMQILDRYFEGRDTTLNESYARIADRALADLLLGGSKLTPWSTHVAAVSFKRNAGCGWPMFVRAKESPFLYYTEACGIEAEGLDLRYASAYPGSSGTRSVSKARGYRAKSRLIFGISRVHNILQTEVWGPAYEYSATLPQFVAWRSREAVDAAITRILESNRKCLSLDFKNFDASVPNDVLVRVFGIMACMFDSAGAALVEFALHSFMSTGILYPRDGFRGGENRTGGIPSGAKLTNLVGSYVNYWVMAYAAAANKCQIHDSLINGDDGVYTFNGPWTKQAFADVLQTDLGMTLSVEKSLESKDRVTFLQMWYDRRLRNGLIFPGMRSIARTVGSMCGRESGPGYERLDEISDFVESPAGFLESVQFLQQVGETSGHPCFEILADWLWEHDPGCEEAVRRLIDGNPVLLELIKDSLGQRSWLARRTTVMYNNATVRYLGTRVT